MDEIQGSDEWLAARCGKPTSSMYSAVLAKGEGKTRKAYMVKLAAERLTGKPAEHFHNAHMDRGTEQEPFARMAYEAHTGNLVNEVGFIQHETLMTGGSPDGLVDHDGGVEIKSVLPTVQIETILKGGYPSGHKAQIQGNLWNTGRAWWDFVSYSPDMPPGLDLYVFRVVRDEAYIKELEAEVVRFLSELDALVSDLSGRKSPLLTLAASREIDMENDQRAKANAGITTPACEQTTAAPDAGIMPVELIAGNAASAASSPPTPEQKRAAVVEAQDDISTFMASRDFGKEPSKIRAILVEFVKHQAARALKVAA